jgi:phage protein D
MRRHRGAQPNCGTRPSRALKAEHVCASDGSNRHNRHADTSRCADLWLLPPLAWCLAAFHQVTAFALKSIAERDWERTPTQPTSEEDAVSELERLEVAVGECREMIREAHAATKDLRSAVREAKGELRALAKDEVAAQVQLEVSRQLDELGERTREAVSAATQKVITEFDRFGESLLGKEAYWQRASGRRSAARPDTDVLTLDVRPDEDKG